MALLTYQRIKLCILMLFVSLLTYYGTIYMQRMDNLMTQQGKNCNVYNQNNLTVKKLDFLCRTMQTSPSAVICLHSDLHSASAKINKLGVFEEHLGHLIISTLKESPDKGFIDIGASIGAHTLPVAVLGNRVIAVEPALINIQRLHKSLILNNRLNANVVIVQNALSDERGTVTAHRSHSNPGLQTIVKYQKPNSQFVDTYKSIYMDDLLEVASFTEATLKVDIESAEPRAFAHAAKLFETINISHVFMEWTNSANYYWTLRKEGKEGKILMDNMLEFFYSRAYQAYTPKGDVLNRQDAEHWPVNIYWLKQFE